MTFLKTINIFFSNIKQLYSIRLYDDVYDPEIEELRKDFFERKLQGRIKDKQNLIKDRKAISGDINKAYHKIISDEK